MAESVVEHSQTAMFDKVLVANRGEIAVRIMRTCQEMGIVTVAVYSEADRDAFHLRAADETYFIGPAPAEESYLNVDGIIDVALRSGAGAVHPGYGFLSENPDFAEACAEAGLAFVGPSAQVLRMVGDKASAKRLAASAGVPVVPGYHGGEQGDVSLLEKARRIGFPMLIKAASGGGGRGMRLVREEAGFAESVQSARREAKSSFGDDTLLLEKFLEQPRHVEVQVIGDTHGNLLSLGERECSIQRRYQKVLEESPSPAVDRELRRQMEAAAIRLAGAAGYSNAGTVEFLLDTDGSFYFLEVNPRLQVEHPVTEWVTGLDLVRLQLLVADGQLLPLRQEEITRRGHSIEARIYAEDPTRGYLPDAGRVSGLTLPSGPWLRHDVGIYEGFEVPVHYDSLLAKLTVYGHDRPQAVNRLQRALAQYSVMGVTTNLQMLRAVVADPEFRSGRTDTGFVARRIDPLMRLEADLPPEVLISATAHKLASNGYLGGKVGVAASGNRDPWRSAGPWRLGRRGMVFRYGCLGRTLEAVASHQPGTHRWRIDAGERTFDVELSVAGDGTVEVRREADRWQVEARHGEQGLHVNWRGRSYRLGEPSPALPSRTASGPVDSGAGTTIEAPMPGLVVQVRVAEQERVTAHQTLLVLEAMKMEHRIVAPFDGVVRRIHCEEGQRVAKGTILLALDRS